MELLYGFRLVNFRDEPITVRLGRKRDGKVEICYAISLGPYQTIRETFNSGYIVFNTKQELLIKPSYGIELRLNWRKNDSTN